MNKPCNIGIYGGDTFSRVLTWTDNADTPYDLTGASVEWALKGGTTEHQWQNDAHVSITDAAAGEITLLLTAEETREMSGRSWKYEVTVTFAGGECETILDGIITITSEVIP